VKEDGANVETSLRNEVRIGDRAIALATAGLLVLMATVYTMTPSPADAGNAGMDPVWPAMSALAVLTLLRIYMSKRAPLPALLSYVTMAGEFIVLFTLILCFEAKYDQPPAFVLKSPTVVWVFVLIGLRALRFDPSEALVAGTMAASGWLGLTLWVLWRSPEDTITHNFVAYMSGPHVLVGAEVEKILAILLFSASLAIAMRRGQRFMKRVTKYADQLVRLLNKQKRLLSALRQESDDRRATAAKLHDALFTDDVTGLASRQALHAELDMRSSPAHAQSAELILVDLRDFRRFNDIMGREAGDALLTKVAAELRAISDPSNFIARVAADEFAILTTNAPNRSVRTELCKTILDRFASGMDAGSFVFQGGVNIGSATAWTDGDVSMLLHNAGLALNEAKRLGRQRWVNYDNAQRTRAERLARLESHLRASLRSDQMWIAYQPIVCIKTGLLAGWEALLRWTHPDLGPVPPDEFVPLLEASGMIHRIGRRSLLVAAGDARRMSDSLGRHDLFMSVNVSPFQLNEPSTLIGAVRRAGLRFPRLKLELTENGVAEDPVRASAVLSQLKLAGVQLSLDDFGTGMSSLAHLQQFEFDNLKIDKAFIRSEQDAFIRGILGLAGSLDLTTIAEGIETKEDRDRLENLGAQYGQGFYWGAAQPVTSWTGDRIGQIFSNGRVSLSRP
jgi:diguanylate cyclase (GGDEF)-like protein